ncbi:MAG: hypothetical protein ACP5VR_08485 [Acidimicrobiales bacterium]
MPWWRGRTKAGPAQARRWPTCSPYLVLVDERVAYARQLYGPEGRLPGGSFDAHISFAQALTEAARATPGALLVVSLPASVDPTPKESRPRAAPASSSAARAGPKPCGGCGR